MKTLNYQEVKKEKEDKIIDLLSACFVFWAFTDGQFEKNKTELKDGEKYISIGACGYMPESQFDFFLEEKKKIEKWYKLQLQKTRTNENDILEELNNYECFYTEDTEYAVSALEDRYTYEEVQAVYKKYRKKMLEMNG